MSAAAAYDRPALRDAWASVLLLAARCSTSLSSLSDELSDDEEEEEELSEEDSFFCCAFFFAGAGAACFLAELVFFLDPSESLDDFSLSEDLFFFVMACFLAGTVFLEDSLSSESEELDSLELDEEVSLVLTMTVNLDRSEL
mmetsp:Transcript_81268/g.218575  ORF Transcript_81268/g.218575 Transcript_81268/m.218575 type:complete len:142 (+) Transcript_81268:182-607(+)